MCIQSQSDIEMQMGEQDTYSHLNMFPLLIKPCSRLNMDGLIIEEFISSPCAPILGPI